VAGSFTVHLVFRAGVNNTLFLLAPLGVLCLLIKRSVVHVSPHTAQFSTYPSIHLWKLVGLGRRYGFGSGSGSGSGSRFFGGGWVDGTLVCVYVGVGGTG